MSIRAKTPAKNPAKIAIKGIGRQFEKMKLGFGMIEQTKDSNLKLLVDKYFQHQHDVSKFLTSLRYYLECQKNLHNAYQQIQSSFSDFYDPEWINRDEIMKNFMDISLIHEDFLSQISHRIIDPYTQYLSRFPLYKEKLDKRGRKLLDYDACKREVENMHLKIAKNKENKEGKDQKMIMRLATLENEFQNIKDQYDKITDELYEELTLLHNNRVVFSAKILESFFQAEDTLHNETKKLFSGSHAKCTELHAKGDEHVYDSDVSRDISAEKFEKLSVLSDDSNYDSPPHPQRQRSGTMERASQLLIKPIWRKTAKISHSNMLEGESSDDLTNGRITINFSPEQSPESPFKFGHTEDFEYDTSLEQRNFLDENIVIVPTTHDSNLRYKHSLDSKLHSHKAKPKKPSRPQTFYFPDYDAEYVKKISDQYFDTKNIPQSTSFYEEDQAMIELNRLNKRRRTLSTQDGMPHVLYRVRALFDYVAHSIDELTLEKDDIVNVTFDSDSQLDEGWLSGSLESYPSKKGIFPANHTTLL